MLLTLLLSLVLILALCLLLYAAVGLIQNRKLFTTAPKDIQAAAKDHPERFYGARALGWKLAVISILAHDRRVFVRRIRRRPERLHLPAAFPPLRRHAVSLEGV